MIITKKFFERADQAKISNHEQSEQARNEIIDVARAGV